MKDYTLTVRQVLENLATLAHSYETVSRGASPTGNYCFSINVADMAASLKAAQVLISQLPYWIPVEERLPEEGERVLYYNGDCDLAYGRMVRIGICIDDGPTGTKEMRICELGRKDMTTPENKATHWMPIPEPPA